MLDADASLQNWLTILNRLKGLTPRYVIPDHGPLGDSSLIGQEYSFIQDVEKRALELKTEGATVDEATDRITEEFRKKYPEWQNINNVENMVRRAYEESQ
jgi:hypothetical protein